MKGAVERGVDANQATYIFDLMEKFAGYGFNKCVHGDTRIMDTDTGQWRRVEDLFKSGARPRVHTCDENYRLVSRQVEDVVWNGVKPVYRLRTTSGREIRATGNHPIKTLSGWVNLENLNVGDRVAQARLLETHGETSWPRHELIVLAGLLSEGNTCHPANLFFYNNDDVLINDFAAAAECFPNTAARISCYDGVRREICLKRARNVPWNSPEFEANRYSGARLWADELGILHKSATKKVIPEPVFGLCDADIELFVGRLWSGDGSLSLKHTSLFYATSSEQLADGLVRLMMRMGIHARIHRKSFRYRDQIKPGYTVHLIGEQSMRHFAERVLPHVIGRAEDCAAIVYHLNTITERSSRDTVPADVRKIVNAARVEQGMTWNQLEAASGCSMKEFYGNGSAGKKGFRHGIIARLADTLDEPQLNALATSDIVWGEIESIDYEGEFDTYDLQIEEHHNFVAEGLVVHNSHSAAYALLSYHTAWLKQHYPAEFMAAVLSADMDNTDKVVSLIEDSHKQGLAVRPPDINRSVYPFSVQDEKTVIYGLGAIKGVGGAALDGIIAEREAERPVHRPVRFLQAQRHPQGQQTRDGSAGQGRRAGRARQEPREPDGQPAQRGADGREGAGRRDSPGNTTCSAMRRLRTRRTVCTLSRSTTGTTSCACSTRRKPWACTSPATRSTVTRKSWRSSPTAAWKRSPRSRRPKAPATATGATRARTTASPA